MPDLFQEYHRRLTELKDAVVYARDRQLGNTSSLWLAWFMFYKAGKPWSVHVIDHLELPPKAAKPVEMAARTFHRTYGLGKGPKDIIQWYEENEVRLDLLDKAGDWPERSAETDVFPYGPFTVHNTVQASGKDLERAKEIVDKALRALPATGLADLKSVAYGDLLLVGQIARKSWGAWYMPDKDRIYLRPSMRGLPVEEIARHLIHELGHRYWKKRLPDSVRKAWASYHYLMDIGSVEVELPEAGDVLPMIVNNKTVKVDRKENSVFYLVDVKTGEHVASVPFLKMYDWARQTAHANKFPSLYARKDAEEHFCETLSLKAVGKLKPENEAEFNRIVLGSAASRVASRWLAGGM